MIIVPSFLARTVAGIPEKESVGFFFLFLSLWLFVLTLKNKKFIKVFTLGLLAGLSTALMALSWGGVVFVYVTIAASCLIGLIINKIHLEQKIGYIAWFSSSLIIIQMFTTRFKLMGFLTSLDTGLAVLVFGIISFSLLIDQLKKRNIEKYIGLTWLKEKTKLPENIIIILMALVFILILASIIIGPSFILNKILDINRIMFNPSSGGRWVTTVAENAQPYFTQWYGSFGQFGFWIFILGSGLFFWNMLSAVFQKKEKIILTLLYGFMVAGIIFSRYAPSSILNGTNFISKAFYLISAISFVAGIIYYYLLGEKTGRKMFDKIDKSWLILFVLLILSLFTARSAIRLIMVISIIGPIFISYIITQLAFSAIYGDKNKKIAYWLTFTVIIIFMVISCNAYYGSITSQSYNYVPYFYTNQWQEAMSWVRTATPTTAVFAQWWDYGYWIQSIGERATMTDGGNSIVYWNYLTGRYVLTGENQKESLEVLYAHNVSYLLIDSSDIGKYGAFSQIGSDINFDRLSSGPLTMMSDPKNTVETRNGYTRIYQGSSYLDEDIKFNNTYMFKENSAILGVELRIDNETIQQPIGIFYNAGQNIRVPLRYLYYNGNMTDFNNGVDAAVYPIQNINLQANNQLSIDTLGGMLYLSPRVLRGYLGQVYILNDPFNNFPNFKLAHTEPDYILKLIMQQNGMVLGDFVLYQGLRGPIKIWDVTYTPDIKLISKYQDKVFPPEINWTF
jgi:asparagine N-glycosylation enzyme membrane subunit Stt3